MPKRAHRDDVTSITLRGRHPGGRAPPMWLSIMIRKCSAVVARCGLAAAYSMANSATVVVPRGST